MNSNAIIFGKEEISLNTCYTSLIEEIESTAKHRAKLSALVKKKNLPISTIAPELSSEGFCPLLRNTNFQSLANTKY